MTTVAVDIDTLNELFDNQKKLDDVLNSMFDEDPFLSTSSDLEYGVGTQKGKQDVVDSSSNDDSLYYDDITFEQKSRSMTYFFAPVVVEIAAIYYGFTYFT